VAVGKDVRRVEELHVPQLADGALIPVRSQHQAPELLLVKRWSTARVVYSRRSVVRNASSWGATIAWSARSVNSWRSCESPATYTGATTS
jgi:hypothetical protein